MATTYRFTFGLSEGQGAIAKAATSPRRRGRPPGSGTLTDDQLRVLVISRGADLWREHPTRGPSKAAVAEKLGLSEGGLQKALDKRGLDWDELRATAFARAFGSAEFWGVSVAK